MKFINKNKFNYKEYAINTEEYYAKRKEHPKPVVLDIREAIDYENGTAEGSHCLPWDYLEDRLIQLPPFGTIILFSDGEDSHIEDSMKLLYENGFTEIFYVEGGLPAILMGLLQFTTEAFEQSVELLKKMDQDAHALEIKIKGRDYWCEAFKDEINPLEYQVIEGYPINIVVLRKHLRRLPDTTVEVKEGALSIDHPTMHLPKQEGTVKDRIQKLLDNEINPGVAAHGGFISLIDVKDDTLYIEMGGGCQGCGMSKITLKQGIETIIKDNVPEIDVILDVTDHASGQNPYYRPEV